MSRLTRDGTAETVSRDQILRRERGQGEVHFPCSADHVQDGQPYMVDPYTCSYIMSGASPPLLCRLHLSPSLFLTFSVLVANPEKLLFLHSGQSRSSWSVEHGNVYSSVYAIPVAYSFLHVPGMYVWSTLSAEYDMDQPGVVASPARGHLKK